MKYFNNKKNLSLIIFCITLILIVIYLGINRTTYAIREDNYLGEYVLNPKFVDYTNLTHEEKKDIEVIPDEFIYQYKKHNKSKISLFKNTKNYPSYYNLNDYGYSTPPDYQGSLGICWAFAAASSMESYLLKNGISDINNPIKISTRQLDYASVHKDNVIEGFNPYYMVGRGYIGSGAKSNTAFLLMSSGISPVTTSKFADSITDTSKKSIGDAINLDNVEYVVDSYVNYGTIGDYTSEEERKSWINNIKSHLLNYGSVAITVKGSSVYSAGSCIHLNEDKSNFLVNQNGDCNGEGYDGHAMAIIGYDDNYTYEYCRLSSTTTNDLTNCDNIVSGSGAFILKNSWGESYPYPYLAYTSNVDASYGITGISSKNWDNNYDQTKVRDFDYKYKLSTTTYYKSALIQEKLKKVSFYVNNTDEIDYQVYVSADGGDNYISIGTVTTNMVGLNSIDCDKDILLSGDKFSIKVVSDNGYVDRIYAFSEKIQKDDLLKVDTVIKNDESYEFNASKLSIYTMTNNVPNGGLIEYQLLDSNGNDITNILDISNNYNLNNQVYPIIKVTSTLPSGSLTLKTKYNNQELDSDIIEVSSLKNLWSGGNGTVDNPYLINNVDDFLKIFTSDDYLKVNYKLVNDLDFSSISDWNAGKLSNFSAFSGSFDGDNHLILGLSASSSIPSIFYSLNNATIKNLVFSECDISFKETGWGNLVAIMAYDSLLENIVITKSVKISGDASYAGGLIGTAYNTDFKFIASYATIDVNYDYNGKASSIVNEGYGILLEECYNYGDILTTKSISGGLVGILKSTNSRISLIKNSYNFGNITSSLIGGGIVGDGENSIIENTYNIFSNKINTNVGNIIGKSYYMGIKNSYYYDKYSSLLIDDVDLSTTLINSMSKTKEQLMNKNTYLNFDFDNVWKIDEGEFPSLCNIYYYYLTDIIVEKKINLEVGDEVQIDLSFSPLSASNKKIRYEVLDSNVIDINNNIIIAKKSGSTILRVSTIDGSGIIKDIAINVIVDEVDLSDYEIIDDIYLKVAKNSNVDAFLNSIYQGNKYRVDVFSENTYIATGDKISIFNKSNEKVNEYTAVVLGDITGNGVIDIGDVAKLYQYIRGNIEMNNEFVLAGDVYRDNKLILNDVAKLYQYIRGNVENLEG